MMRIDYYYWSNQCPINWETRKLLDSCCDRIEIHYHDIANDPKLCQEQRIFFPFLTVFNRTHRWHSPLRASVIEQLLQGETPLEKPYIIPLGEKEFCGELHELNEQSIQAVAPKCTLHRSAEACSCKARMLKAYGNRFFGALHYDQDLLVGGAEYIPSIHVPYDIPKNADTAFLSCLYSSSSDFDFRSSPLRELEQRLAQDYRKMVVISDEASTFPNGNVPWFRRRGYQDEGILYEHEGYCRLHLMSKMLEHQ